MVPDTGTATWQAISVSPFSAPPHTLIECRQYIMEYTVTGEDTIVGGQTFKKVYRKISGKSTAVPYGSSQPCTLPEVDLYTPFFTEEYYTAIREEDKRVYIPNWPSPFFDFNLEVGQGNKAYTGVVIQIDTVQVMGSLRKRFIMSTLSGPDTVIEGIGSMRRGAIKVTDVVNSKNALTICHTRNGNNDYHDINIPCTNFYLTFPAEVNNPGKISAIKVFPNPFNSSLHISTPETLRVCLYDNWGQLIWENDVAGNKIISTGFYKRGIYLLTVKDSKGNILKTEKLLNE